MPRAKMFLNAEERYELANLFHNYHVRHLHELLDQEIVPLKYVVYMPYLEGEAFVGLTKALDEYDKNSERSKKKRILYFKAFADKVIENHIKEVVLSMNAAIARVEGTASRSPLKADKRLYDTLCLIEEGQDLLEKKLKDIQNN